MLKVHGTFSTYSDPTRPGVLMMNEEGQDWHHYVLSRVIFDGGGKVHTLFEHGSMKEIVEGDRFFAAIVDGVVVYVANRDLSALEPRNSLVVETSEAIAAGMVYVNGAFEPAPPPPYVPISLSADLLFFDRMTDDEYDDLDTSVRAVETARVYRGWAAAASFTEGTDMWALLVKHLDAIGTTSSRKGELLARLGNEDVSA